MSSTSGWDITLAISTVVLAIATVGLAIGTLYLVTTGLRQMHADHARRRGEATANAVTRFNEATRTHNAVLVKLAREETASRKEKDPHVQPVTTKELIRAHATPDVRRPLDAWLAELEILSLGARLGLYDENLLYHTSRTAIRQLWDISHPFVTDLRQGQIDKRPAQESAFEHCEWLVKKFDDMEGLGVEKKLSGTLPWV